MEVPSGPSHIWQKQKKTSWRKEDDKQKLLNGYWTQGTILSGLNFVGSWSISLRWKGMLVSSLLLYEWSPCENRNTVGYEHERVWEREGLKLTRDINLWSFVTHRPSTGSFHTCYRSLKHVYNHVNITSWTLPSKTH